MFKSLKVSKSASLRVGELKSHKVIKIEELKSLEVEEFRRLFQTGKGFHSQILKLSHPQIITSSH